MSVSSLAALIDALRVLPGVGPKSAQRMAFHLLERNRAGAARLNEALAQALSRVRRCDVCRDLTDDVPCARCSDARRDQTLVCVVESPADVAALEQAGGYRGAYFVLHGHLSPIDGVGPEQLGLDAFERRLSAPQRVQEVIVATNPTVEGEATAHYLAELVRERGIRVSRIAHGVPIGGEIEYLDAVTLAQALSARRELP
jgi:recombination protein RecR